MLTSSNVGGCGPEGNIPGQVTAAEVMVPPIMEFAINATTKIQFRGEWRVQEWTAHRFSTLQLLQLCLVTQAKQC